MRVSSCNTIDRLRLTISSRVRQVLLVQVKGDVRWAAEWNIVFLVPQVVAEESCMR